MKQNERLQVYLVDDEPLAIKQLTKLLAATNLVEIVGSATNPQVAQKFLTANSIDILFLDIQMPGMNGFELLSNLAIQPLVIFTTAFDKYALKAFEVNSIDYLLKPIDAQKLERALAKSIRLSQRASSIEKQAYLESMLLELAKKFSISVNNSPNRISSRVGDHLLFIDLDNITHFFSEDKLTFAATTDGKKYIMDFTIAELEQKLADREFVRIHRATIVNLEFIHELHRWFGGRMLIRMKDKNQTQLTVARNKTEGLKKRLGL